MLSLNDPNAFISLISYEENHLIIKLNCALNQLLLAQQQVFIIINKLCFLFKSGVNF